MAPINRVAAVDVGDETITFRWTGGSTASLPWEDIERVVIRTTDAGPFDDDVFFVVQAAGKNYVIPQAAPGASQLLERFQQLPDFDNEAIINSMGCTDNQEFVCWEREWPRRGGRPMTEGARNDGHQVLEYQCADCQQRFSISVTDDEMQTALDSSHTEKCPNCGQRAGWGHVTCRQCGEEFVVELLHWHVHCTLAGDKCPKCGTEYVSGCIC